MRDAARIQTVIEILENIKKSPIPMDNVLRDYMKNRRYIGSKDRKAIVEMVYDCVRATARLGWWLDNQKAEDTPRSRVIAFLALNGLSAHDITIRFVEEKHCPEPLHEDEEKLVAALVDKTLKHDDMPEAVKVECPEIYVERLKALWGDEFASQMQAMREGA